MKELIVRGTSPQLAEGSKHIMGFSVSESRCGSQGLALPNHTRNNKTGELTSRTFVEKDAKSLLKTMLLQNAETGKSQ